jgi:adenylylsulfate kinase-like enzyme
LIERVLHGIVDGYPHARLARMHGDFHPFNIVFDGAQPTMLDASRGVCGDPADDLTALAVNFLLFALSEPERGRPRQAVCARARPGVGGGAVSMTGTIAWFTGLPASGKSTLADFYRALAELAALIAGQGPIVLVAATAPRRVHRDHARFASGRFLEVWVRATPAECEARDIKGLYAQARRGDITTLPGIGVPFEAPEHPAVIAKGGRDGAAVTAIVQQVTQPR